MCVRTKNSQLIVWKTGFLTSQILIDGCQSLIFTMRLESKEKNKEDESGISKQLTGRSISIEQSYVHDVYEKIARDLKHSHDSFSAVVEEFLENLEPGSCVADIGCGSGRYLASDKTIFCIGADYCAEQTQIAREDAKRVSPEVIRADNLNLPYMNETFDAVTSVDVIHHFATCERRVRALRELGRILRIGGKVLITVQATENNVENCSQDVLIPWYEVMKDEHNQRKQVKSADTISEEDADTDGQSFERDNSSVSSDGEDDDDAIAYRYSRCEHTSETGSLKRIVHGQEDFNGRGYYNTAAGSEQATDDIWYGFVRRRFGVFSPTSENLTDEINTGNILAKSHNGWCVSQNEDVCGNNFIEIRNLDGSLEQVFGHPSLPQHKTVSVDAVKKAPRFHKKIVKSFSELLKSIPIILNRKNSSPISASDIQSHCADIYRDTLIRSQTTATCTSHFECYSLHLENEKETKTFEDESTSQNRDDFHELPLTDSDIVNGNNNSDESIHSLHCNIQKPDLERSSREHLTNYKKQCHEPDMTINFSTDEDIYSKSMQYFNFLHRCPNAVVQGDCRLKHRQNSTTDGTFCYFLASPTVSSERLESRIVSIDSQQKNLKPDGEMQCGMLSSSKAKQGFVSSAVEDPQGIDSDDSNEQNDKLACSEFTSLKLARETINQPTDFKAQDTISARGEDYEDIINQLKSLGAYEREPDHDRDFKQELQMVSSKTVGPFYEYDDTTDDNIALSSYYSMPELYSLAEYYKNYIEPKRSRPNIRSIKNGIFLTQPSKSSVLADKMSCAELSERERNINDLEWVAVDKTLDDAAQNKSVPTVIRNYGDDGNALKIKRKILMVHNQNDAIDVRLPANDSIFCDKCNKYINSMDSPRAERDGFDFKKKELEIDASLLKRSMGKDFSQLSNGSADTTCRVKNCRSEIDRESQTFERTSGSENRTFKDCDETLSACVKNSYDRFTGEKYLNLLLGAPSRYCDTDVDFSECLKESRDFCNDLCILRSDELRSCNMDSLVSKNSAGQPLLPAVKSCTDGFRVAEGGICFYSERNRNPTTSPQNETEVMMDDCSAEVLVNDPPTQRRGLTKISSPEMLATRKENSRINENCSLSTPKYRVLTRELRDSTVNNLQGFLDSGSAEVTMHRYFHKFREGELETLIEHYVNDLHVLHSFQHHQSWCVVAEKVQVWKI